VRSSGESFSRDYVRRSRPLLMQTLMNFSFSCSIIHILQLIKFIEDILLFTMLVRPDFLIVSQG
jgi:hypothetical protein